MKTTQELLELQVELARMNPVDIANRMEDLEPKDVAIWVQLLTKEHLADTFAEMNRDHKEALIQTLSDSEITEIIAELDSHEVVDTLQELPANLVNRMLQLVDQERRPIINELMGYPEDSVGSIMTVDYILGKTTNTTSLLKEKVLNSPLDADKLEQIWMIGPTFKLEGFISLADLFRHESEDLTEIIRPIHGMVSAYDDQEVVADLAYKYDLSAVPVVDSTERLVGTIPAEWIIDIVAEELGEDMTNLAGIMDPDQSEYLDETILGIAKNRITWLAVCLITATLTGFIIQRYESVLATSVALTAYIPMLMDSGGNAGNQTTSTLIKAMALNEIESRDYGKVIWRELRVGLIVGVALVIINMIRIIILDPVGWDIILIISLTLLVTIVISKLIGGILPMIAVKFKVDPTVMAGPLLTTIVDTVALLIYFEIAQTLLVL